MKNSLTFLVLIASSTGLFAEPGSENVWRVSQQIAYQPNSESGTAQSQTIPESEPQVPPPPPPQTQTVSQTQSPFQSLLMSRRDYRLARTPHMFGDYLGAGPSLSAIGITTSGSSTIPLGGGNRRFSVADNNMALPVDRWYFAYNHFHNAINTISATNRGTIGENSSIDQFTFGYERTFGDFQNSLEIRVPFVNDYEFASPSFGVLGGSVGNLFINYKRVLTQGENAALSGGIGLGIPTGGDVLGYTGIDVFKVENDAVHFNPFLALVGTPENGSPFFYHAFAQFDFAANGNDVVIVQAGDRAQAFRAGRIDDKNLFHFDIGGGYWLFQNRHNNFIEALAAIFELHSTHTISGSDSVAGFTSDSFFGFSTPSADSHILNLTTGVHAQLAPLVNLRLAMIYPLRDGDGLHREFDAEFLLSLIVYR